MLVKVSSSPVQSLMSQGFQLRKIKGEDYLAKGGNYFHCPRSVERAVNAATAGRKTKPFQFLLKAVSPVIDNAGRGKPKIDETVTLNYANIQGEKTNNPDRACWVTYPERKVVPRTSTPVLDKVKNTVSPSSLPTVGSCCKSLSSTQSPKTKFVLNDGLVTFFHNGKCFSSSKANPMFNTIVEHLKSGNVQKASELVNIANAIDVASQGIIKNDGGVLKYNGQNLNETAEEWLVRNMDKGMAAIQPIVNFLARVKTNVHPESVEGLWRFVKECGLVVTDEGKFIAYKYTDDDFMDSHSRTMKYTLGSTVEMPRDKVEFNPSVTCAPGIHAGSMSYIGNKSTLLELVIDPIDVVSVPFDYKSGKIRCCRVKVHKVLKNKWVNINPPTKQEEFFVLNQ